MGDALSKLFVPLHSLPGLYALPAECVEPSFDASQHLEPTLGGVAQLLFLGAAYGMVLFHASKMIADGSELLLLIPQIAPVVGSVVIPILGAVPDGAVVLFSGLGDMEKAREQLSVGVGALAGSTIMLLTVPWFLSVLAGRVSVNEHGKCTYAKPAAANGDWAKLDKKDKVFETGVEPDSKAMRAGAKTMAMTSMSYLIIQGAASVLEAEHTPEDDLAKRERVFALLGLILCVSFFVWYLQSQIRHSESDEVLQDFIDRKRETAVKSGLLSLQGAFFDALSEYHTGSVDAELLDKKKERFEAVVRKFFQQYDVNKDDLIDKSELTLLLTDLHIPHTPDAIQHFMREMDADGDQKIHFNEFVDCMIRLIESAPSDRSIHGGNRSARQINSHLGDRIDQLMRHSERSSEQVRENISRRQNELLQVVDGETSARVSLEDSDNHTTVDEDDAEEEEEEIPEDLASLPPNVQRRRILLRAIRLMLSGTALVLVFSDPMVDVMSEIGNVMGVKPFYISFILAPLASNASELIASFSYAQKKTTKTITISLTSLTGAAIMNNTFCLSIFLGLVYFRGLEWKFSAETIAILFVEATMAYVAHWRVQTVKVAVFVLALLPASLLLVYILENVFHLD